MQVHVHVAHMYLASIGNRIRIQRLLHNITRTPMSNKSVLDCRSFNRTAMSHLLYDYSYTGLSG